MDHTFVNLINVIKDQIRLTAEDIDVITGLFQPSHLRKGEYFLRQGEVSNKMAFVTKGIVRYFISKDGDEQTYNFAKENDFVCNYESMIRQTPSVKCIQAIEDTGLLVIRERDLKNFYCAVKEGERFGRLHMENVYTDTLRHLVSRYTETPESRYLHFLERYPELQQRIPQYYIASFIGVKPPSLSRIRKRLAARRY